MTPRSIRRAQERKARKEMDRKAKNIALRAEEPLIAVPNSEPETTPDIFEEDDSEPPTVSESKLKANRANAQLSTGPKSEEGRAKVSLNAVKTALTGRTVLLPSDDAAAYQHHIDAFAADYAPLGPRESELVQSIADTWWRLQRVPCLESALFAQGRIEFAGAFDDQDAANRPSLIDAQTFLKYEKQIRNLQLQEARLFRRYEKDRAELVSLEQARKQREAEALEDAALAYRTAKQMNQPFPAADFGFEFSTAQIEQHLERIEARELRLAAMKSPSKTRSQAA